MLGAMDAIGTKDTPEARDVARQIAAQLMPLPAAVSAPLVGETSAAAKAPPADRRSLTQTSGPLGKLKPAEPDRRTQSQTVTWAASDKWRSEPKRGRPTTAAGGEGAKVPGSTALLATLLGPEVMNGAPSADPSAQASLGREARRSSSVGGASRATSAAGAVEKRRVSQPSVTAASATAAAGAALAKLMGIQDGARSAAGVHAATTALQATAAGRRGSRQGPTATETLAAVGLTSGAPPSRTASQAGSGALGPAPPEARAAAPRTESTASNQYGGSQHGGSQHGSSRRGTSQHGGSQHGGSQHGGSRHPSRDPSRNPSRTASRTASQQGPAASASAGTDTGFAARCANSHVSAPAPRPTAAAAASSDDEYEYYDANDPNAEVDRCASFQPNPSMSSDPVQDEAMRELRELADGAEFARSALAERVAEEEAAIATLLKAEQEADETTSEQAQMLKRTEKVEQLQAELMAARAREEGLRGMATQHEYAVDEARSVLETLKKKKFGGAKEKAAAASNVTAEEAKLAVATQKLDAAGEKVTALLVELEKHSLETEQREEEVAERIAASDTELKRAKEAVQLAEESRRAAEALATESATALERGRISLLGMQGVQAMSMSFGRSETFKRRQAATVAHAFTSTAARGSAPATAAASNLTAQYALFHSKGAWGTRFSAMQKAGTDASSMAPIVNSAAAPQQLPAAPAGGAPATLSQGGGTAFTSGAVSGALVEPGRADPAAVPSAAPSRDFASDGGGESYYSSDAYYSDDERQPPQ